MLIIDAPDLAGKTTLCHALLKRLWEQPKRYGPWPAIYGHFSALPPAWHYPKSYFPYITRYTVMDRFHISELCYGPVTRGRSMLEHGGVRWLENQLGLVGTVTVMITLKEDFLREQWAKKNREEMFKLEQVLAVNKRYQQLGDYYPEARVDFNFELESEADYLSSNEAVMDQILSAWSQRLCETMVHGADGAGERYLERSKAVEEALRDTQA